MEAMLDITIRNSAASDLRALERLATLDGRRLGAHRYLLAEAGGELVAAIPTEGGEAIADPFKRTAAIVELLDLRGRAVTRGAGQRRTGLLRRAVRPLSRAAAQA